MANRNFTKVYQFAKNNKIVKVDELQNDTKLCWVYVVAEHCMVLFFEF